MRKTVIKFFTIADYEEEEIWLRGQHGSGWKMVSFTPPCFYVFEACEPRDVVYRLAYTNTAPLEDYLKMAEDFGWEYFAQIMGWIYFRKPADASGSDGDDQLLSDSASRVEMAENVVRTRLLPLCLIFFGCVIPNLFNAVSGRLGVLSVVLSVFFGAMFAIYAFLIVYCGIKLKKLKEKYQS